jgi:hypothetical protein
MNRFKRWFLLLPIGLLLLLSVQAARAQNNFLVVPITGLTVTLDTANSTASLSCYTVSLASDATFTPSSGDTCKILNVFGVFELVPPASSGGAQSTTVANFSIKNSANFTGFEAPAVDGITPGTTSAGDFCFTPVSSPVFGFHVTTDCTINGSNTLFITAVPETRSLLGLSALVSLGGLTLIRHRRKIA